LEDFIQNHSILVNSTPQPELAAFDRHNNLVKMPDIIGLGLPTA
jgi:hypothetical protein